MRSIKLSRKSFFILPAIVLSIFLFDGCAAGSKMNSLWQNNEIKIDGVASEWNTSIQQMPDKKINIGFRNDDKYLYLCLTSEDRSRIMMIARAGLIIWFEPESGDKNKFGIRYPMVITQSAPMQMPELNREDGRIANIDKLLIKMLEQQNEFQIINKDKFPLTALPIMNNEGIEAKLGYHSNQFVYELKVPLAASKQFSFAVDALPGEKVTVKFETEELDLENIHSPESGGSIPPRGTGRGGNRRGGGSEGRRPGMGGGNMMEPINYTVEIKLEAPPISK